MKDNSDSILKRLTTFISNKKAFDNMPIEIPYSKLSQDVLQGIIDDFILREGTDYGHQDYSIDSKRQKVIKQLKTGKVKIFFDEETETCTLISHSD